MTLHDGYVGYNVQKNNGKWEVLMDGSDRVSKTADTEAKAIDKARDLAKKNAPAEVRVRASRSGSQHDAGQFRVVHAYHDHHMDVYNVQESHTSDKKWEVRKEDGDRASATADTERQALKRAKELAKKNTPAEVRIRTSRTGSVHKHGQWRAEYTYN